ncbi:hypothetical protein MUO93_11940 [Candidatus Bathyarchaeota archaeon]|nr:hypothetical protein [Candidatus Bathyarchaeota archaeon]
MKEHLSKYKRDVLRIDKSGKHNGREYPHILPKEQWEKNLWEGSQEKILKYIENEGINWHTGKAHLNSSQIFCFNLFYPFIGNLQPFEPYFMEHVKGFQKFGNYMKFEFTNRSLLNEKTPTNIDLAIDWIESNSERNLFLFEFKYTENSFGGCKNYNKEKCTDLRAVQDINRCHLREAEVEYWKYLGANGPIKIDKLANSDTCPFKGGLYQLMRNQLLAHRLEESGKYNKVVFGAIYPQQNTLLHNQLNKIRILDNTTVPWESLLKEPYKFLRVPLEDLFASLINQNVDEPWKDFITKKHGPTLIHDHYN